MNRIFLVHATLNRYIKTRAKKRTFSSPSTTLALLRQLTHQGKTFKKIMELLNCTSPRRFEDSEARLLF